jgi:uncharacterized PurR-regulated membrane protein YhhQ (DUF165 family)
LYVFITRVTRWMSEFLNDRSEENWIYRVLLAAGATAIVYLVFLFGLINPIGYLFHARHFDKPLHHAAVWITLGFSAFEYGKQMDIMGFREWRKRKAQRKARQKQQAT